MLITLEGERCEPSTSHSFHLTEKSTTTNQLTI